MALDGPRRAPASGGPAQHLVVFLHGLGSNGDDLMGLAPVFAQALPHAAFASPNAPHPFAFMPGGYQWFGIDDPSQITPAFMADGVAAAAPYLDEFLDAELKRTGVTADKLALVGFSQGCMMALHVGLRRLVSPAAIVGYSGVLTGVDRLAGEIKSRPPTLMVHGDMDPVVPYASLAAAERALADVDVPVITHTSRGAPHTIAQDGVMLGMKHLQHAFGADGGQARGGPGVA